MTRTKSPNVRCRDCGWKGFRRLQAKTASSPRWYDPCPKCNGKVERTR